MVTLDRRSGRDFDSLMTPICPFSQLYTAWTESLSLSGAYVLLGSIHHSGGKRICHPRRCVCTAQGLMKRWRTTCGAFDLT